MGSRLGRRVIHFANLPIKLLMPSSFQNIREIALKTIPSASKIEIKRVLESLYGFDVERVHTLNMEGKKRKRGGILIAKPDYKKAYVTLKTPLSVSPDLYPIRLIEEERQNAIKKSKSSIVEDKETRSHWLDSGEDGSRLKGGKRSVERGNRRPPPAASAKTAADAAAGKTRFPWSSMRSWRQWHHCIGGRSGGSRPRERGRHRISGQQWNLSKRRGRQSAEMRRWLGLDRWEGRSRI